MSRRLSRVSKPTETFKFGSRMIDEENGVFESDATEQHQKLKTANHTGEIEDISEGDLSVNRAPLTRDYSKSPQ